jgi:hypothetical protein
MLDRELLEDFGEWVAYRTFMLGEYDRESLLEEVARELSDVLDRLDERQFRAALADIAKVLVPAEVELLQTFTYEETCIAATAIKGRSEHAGGYEPIRIELIERAESTAA